MKRFQTILICIGSLVLLAVSWLVAFTAKSDLEKQTELLDRVDAYLKDDVYISTVPLLEEAVSYETERTPEAVELLKTVYLHLGSQGGYINKYRDILNQQMAAKDAGPEVFIEAGLHYLSYSRLNDALDVLRAGVEKTGDEKVIKLYEENRYGYYAPTEYYQNVTEAYNGAIQVCKGGLWGAAASDGTLIIDCAYDKVSTYSNSEFIVKRDDEIWTVDSSGYRTQLLHENADDFGNLAENRTSLKFSDGWKVATGNFELGSSVFEEIGMFSGGYCAAKKDGKWGVIASNGSDWYIPPQYDDVIRDSLGRCCGQNCIFVREGDKVLLFVDGKKTDNIYEEARPFADGWAAVKKNGKWGYIDTSGKVMVDFQFEDALSYGQHLAAVKVDGLWGYVSLLGEVVIEPQYLDARSFYQGSAPVLNEMGWGFISLREYK